MRRRSGKSTGAPPGTRTPNPAAPKLVGHLFPRLLGKSDYSQWVKDAAPLMEAALRWLAAHIPAAAELVRLLDATPIPCGQSVITVRRSDLFGCAGYGDGPSHSRWYWGTELMLIVTREGTVTGYALANPKLMGDASRLSGCCRTGLPTARRPAPPSSPIRACSRAPSMPCSPRKASGFSPARRRRPERTRSAKGSSAPCAGSSPTGC